MTEPEITIMSARIDAANGVVAAYVEWVPVGGGFRTVNIDGTLEDQTHPLSFLYHARLISPDRMIPDQLLDAPSYEEACAIAVKYANKLNEHAKRSAELGEDLRM
jgi:hypothetical protein